MVSQKAKTNNKQQEKTSKWFWKYSIDLQNNYQILLENNDWLWQAKLLGDWEIMVILQLVSKDHCERAIRYLIILQEWEKYLSEQDALISDEVNQEIENFLSSL